MINNSILTTLYSRLGFQSHTLEELFDGGKGVGKKFGLSKLLSDREAYIENFLPALRLPASQGTATVLVDLHFQEVDHDDRGKWESILRLASSGKDSEVPSGTPSDGISFLLFEKNSENEWVPASYHENTIDTISSGYYRFTLIIAVNRIKKPASYPNKEAFRRTEVVASELISGYRRLICCLQHMLGDALYHGVAGGKASASDLHSTQEDGYRLMCNFKDVEKSIWELLHEGHGRRINSLDEFLRLRIDGHRFICELCQVWATTRRVRQAVVRKKLFEYFIYRSL